VIAAHWAARPEHPFRTAALLLAIVAIASCSSAPDHQPAFGHGTLLIGSPNGPVTLSVRTASTAEAKAQGLMGQSHLPESTGMAFLSEQPTTTPFWMKDTTIPLSVAFWNAHHRIVDMLDMNPCTSDPCPLYRSSSPYVGAVEVNRGFFDDHGVQVGDLVQLKVPVSF
jgi:uncharacterized membrane protein (UPF0127 family)